MNIKNEERFDKIVSEYIDKHYAEPLCHAHAAEIRNMLEWAYLAGQSPVNENKQ